MSPAPGWIQTQKPEQIRKGFGAFLAPEESRGNSEDGSFCFALLPRQPRRTGETRERRSRSTTDLLRLYLQDIGRVDLLTNEEEVTLARLVQQRETLLHQQRELAEHDPAINELHRLEELQRREANQHSHWPTRQEWARAANISLQDLQNRIDSGYAAWAQQASLEPKALRTALRELSLIHI